MISLKRMYQPPKIQNLNGVFGVLSFDNGKDRFSLVTWEKPWVPGKEYQYGKPYDSCVPAGTYEIEKAVYAKFREFMWALKNEGQGVVVNSFNKTNPNMRYGCHFTSDNPLNLPEGVICVGVDFVDKGGKRQVSDSRYAYQKLNNFLIENPEEKTISITWAQ